MKDHRVKALFDFYDKEENEQRFRENDRHIASIWDTTEERYEYLKSRNAVELLEVIDEKKKEEAEEKKEIEEEIKKIVKSRKRRTK